MKRFIISFFLLTFLAISVFAQSLGPWKVKVKWQVTSSSTCQFQDLVHDRFLVTITIIDEANDVTVVNNKSQIEPNDATSSIIDVQQELEAHCNDTSLANVPVYKIYTAVRMVNIQSQFVYCMEKDPGTLTNCQEMSTNGKEIPQIWFD